MKVTKSQLRNIINEAVSKTVSYILNEDNGRSKYVSFIGIKLVNMCSKLISDINEAHNHNAIKSPMLMARMTKYILTPIGDIKAAGKEFIAFGFGEVKYPNAGIALKKIYDRIITACNSIKYVDVNPVNIFDGLYPVTIADDLKDITDFVKTIDPSKFVSNRKSDK